MGAVKNLIVRIGGDFSDLQKKMTSASKELGKMGNQMQSAGKGMTLGITVPVLGIGAAALKTAADIQESQSRMSSVLGSLSGDAGKFITDFSNKLGISQKALNDHVATLTLMGTNYGLTQDEAYGMSKSMAQITADAAAFNNMGFDETSERLGAALRGEGEAAEALGLSINQTTLAEYARSQGVTESITKLSQAELMQLRYGLIVQQTGQMTGYAEKEATGYNATMVKLQTAVQNLLVPIGTLLIPIMIELANRLKAAAEWFQGLSPEMQKNAVTFALVAAAIGPVITVIGTMIGTVGAIMAWGGGVAKAFAAVQAGTAGMGAIFTAIFSPAGLVILAIGATIAAGYLLWKNWDTIKAKASEIGASISNTFNNIKNAISNAINGAKDAVGNAINAIKGFFSFKFSWPSMPMPHFSVNPSGWKIGDLLKGSIPSLGVNWYDKGGVFSGPSVIGVGEKRPEFVGALDDLRYIVRDEMGGGSANIIVELDGYTIAKAIGQPLTDLIRVKTGLRI